MLPSSSMPLKHSPQVSGYPTSKLTLEVIGVCQLDPIVYQGQAGVLLTPGPGNRSGSTLLGGEPLRATRVSSLMPVAAVHISRVC